MLYFCFLMNQVLVRNSDEIKLRTCDSFNYEVMNLLTSTFTVVHGRAGSNLREKRCFLLLLKFLCPGNRVQEPKGLGRCACISGLGYIDP